jgi:hypothetical protein
MTDFDYSQPHKLVNGLPVLLTADEIAEQQARQAEWEAGEQRRAIIQQIVELEAKVTQRRIREATLDIDNGWLRDLNDQIAALRGQL